MRLTDWPRMPFLNDEVKEWIALELEGLGVEDLAVYALEAGTEGDERRVMVATEIGLLDHRYAPFGSSARYRLAMLLYPWQVIRGVELRADTFRLWAREHRTRWSFRLHHPHFEAATESADLGQALCDLARVCAVMAEPFGVPAGRASSEVPGALPGGPRPMSAAAPGAASAPTPMPVAAGEDAFESEGHEPHDVPDVETAPGPDEGEGAEAAPNEGEIVAAADGAAAHDAGNGVEPPSPLAVAEGEEVIDLSVEDRAAIPTRSDDPY